MKHTSRCTKQRKHPKTRLRLPDLEFSKTAVLNSLTSADGQRGYSHAIDEFVDWYCSEPRLALNRTVVLRYRSYLEARLLAPGTINLRLGAVRRLAYAAADSGLLSSDLAAGIRRVKGVRNLGVRLGNWLTVEQSLALWQAPDCKKAQGQARQRTSCAVACLWSASPRSRWSQNRTSGTTGGTLGYCRSEGQGGTCSHDSCSRLGAPDVRSVTSEGTSDAPRSAVMRMSIRSAGATGVIILRRRCERDAGSRVRKPVWPGSFGFSGGRRHIDESTDIVTNGLPLR